MPDFSHLHVHTQFSLLDGAADVKKLFKKAAADGMKAMAITDHGNMFGVFKFVAEAAKHNVKPIVGCEFYVVENRHKRQFTKDDRDQRFHQLLLAKNPKGYQNLLKLCSLGYIDGLYGKYPRIDKELILQYHEGLIATTCCIGASVPKAILRKGEQEAEKEFKWWLDIFGEDYYVELQRHDMQEQEKVNQVLLGFAKKYNVKVIASNDAHYVDQKDSNAHDILLCINTGEKQSTPTMKEFSDDETFTKGRRFAFYNDQFYFKTQAEMNKLFQDIPEAIDNTNEIVEKVEHLKLKQDIMLPNFQIPTNFTSQDEYLHHLTYTGAKERYRDISPEIEERLNFELHTIRTMGFAGYFLIVADFIKAGRDIGVFVGPGRGSAAGSAVAYCIGITNIDPIKYNLLFERFLNPDRKSMPDIDTDFDDEGRQKVIDYVVEKYGKNQVAQIVTYGTMAAKMSIKDVARVMDLPLQESNALAKLVPDKPGTELNRVMLANIDGPGGLKDVEAYQPEDMENIKILREIYKTKDLKADVLREALILEGSVRGTGIHAAGIIIAPKDLTEIIPVATSKETELLITQYDGKVIEDAGVIKMDFLGLKTLTIIRDALVMIKKNKGIVIDIDKIPLDDAKTLALYQRGDTNGTFQFESPGMMKHLIDLKPDKFEDLIAMNALYRPGPIQYIPKFIARKHGREQVSYDLPEMEEYLSDTYGITVYQEQVMLLSQKIGGFTKGQADTLRKAMGKKDRQILDGLKSSFMNGAKEKGLNEKALDKIWTDWEAFASYAFNKSHSTCYAFVAFQTAYLKAHYPAEYMSSVLTHNLNNIDKITFFMEEARRMNISVLGPDINESIYPFSVNEVGQIRFGLGAIKGVGEAAVQSIIEERDQNGRFSSVFDLVRRINLRTANKKTFESLAQAGAFDSFGIHRAAYFNLESNESQTTLEKLIRFGANYQDSLSTSQSSLFGAGTAAHIPEPKLPSCEEWGFLQKLRFEKEVVGFYISGHPLDEYKFELSNFCSATIADLKMVQKFAGNSNSFINNKASDSEGDLGQAVQEQDIERFDQMKNRELAVAGMITVASHRTTKTGKPYGTFMLEDYQESHEIALFGEDYIKFKQFITDGYFLYIKGKIQERYGRKGEWEFKVNFMQLLPEVRDKMAKNMTIYIYLSDLNEAVVDDITSLIEQNNQLDLPRNCNLKIGIIDTEDGISVEVPSRKFKINPTNEFMQGLSNLNGVNYRLN
jgi:DNA polymerase-3 subunit alpha